MKFCKLCNNILQINIQNDTLSFKCRFCNKLYKSNAEDSLRYEYSKKKSLGIYNKQLDNIHNDPTQIEKLIDCPKCNHYLCKQLEITDLKLFNICINCKNIWMYNSVN